MLKPSAMEPEIVARIAKALGGHDQIADEYACNVESALRDRGEHALAAEWLEEVESCIVEVA